MAKKQHGALKIQSVNRRFLVSFELADVHLFGEGATLDEAAGGVRAAFEMLKMTRRR